ncbi:MAG TPA: hypothetical protein PLZ32_15970 [Saprospiraceae bacterium]|nr:hypothetical protein [Saprospiraceae bacterium]
MGVFGQGIFFESRKEGVPGNLHRLTHVPTFAVDGKDRIVLGHDDAILAVSTVATIEAGLAAPKLITITLTPVAVIVLRWSLFFGRFLDLAFRNQLFALPITFL